jgi:hypothetical protein
VKVLPIPGSTKAPHAVENLSAKDVKLTAKDLAALEALASDVVGARGNEMYLNGTYEGQMKNEPIEMKVTTKKGIGFYIRSAATFLKGAGDKESVSEMQISALGNAINAAVAVAAQVEKDGLGKITKISTAYPEMLNGPSCGQMVIDIKKN